MQAVARHDGWRTARWGGIALILLAPLVAMRFTREVAWTASDFAAAFLLLGGAALIYEMAVRLVRTGRQRALVGAVLIMAVALVWAEGAVGIFR